MIKKLPKTFFQTDDTLKIGQNLLGKFLVSSIGGEVTSGMIVETEGYLGVEDRASHAFSGRRTKRTEVLYLPGGHMYAYLCYGVHTLLNIVTRKKDIPHGVLLRAIEPVDGIDIMLKRRNFKKVTPALTKGPGALAKALGITTDFSGEELGDKVWIEDRGVIIPKSQIVVTTRVGVDYAKEHALLPYRFYIKGNVFVSKTEK